MDLNPPRGTADLLAPRSEVMLDLDEAAHRNASLFGYRYGGDPHLRVHGVLRADQWRNVRCREQGDVHVRRQGGRSVTLRPSPRRRSCAPTSITRRSCPRRSRRTTSTRTSVTTGRRPGGCVSSACSGARSRGRGAAADVEVIAVAHHYLARGLRDVALHLNSIGDEVCRPAYRERLIAYLEPHEPDLDEDAARACTRTPCACSTARWTAARTTSGRRPSSVTTSRRGVPGALRRGEGRPVRRRRRRSPTTRVWCGGSTTTRGPRSSSSVGPLAPRRPRSAAGGGTTGWPRHRRAPRRASGSAMGLDRVLLAMEGEACRCRGTRGVRCFVVALGEDCAGRRRRPRGGAPGARGSRAAGASKTAR